MIDPDTTWQRARRPEQIAERRSSILAATRELLDEGGLEAAGLNAIARRVGLSKANLYRYFESREAILLELMLDEFRDWCEEVGRALACMKKTGPGQIEPVARLLADQHAARPRLGRLFHALPGIIEHNISLETAIAFKSSALHLLEDLSRRLARVFPEFGEEDAAQFLMHWYMGICGAWAHCHPHPVIEQAMEHLGKAEMMRPYAETIYAMAVPMLRGILKSQR